MGQRMHTGMKFIEVRGDEVRVGDLYANGATVTWVGPNEEGDRSDQFPWKICMGESSGVAGQRHYTYVVGRRDADDPPLTKATYSNPAHMPLDVVANHLMTIDRDLIVRFVRTSWSASINAETKARTGHLLTSVICSGETPEMAVRGLLADLIRQTGNGPLGGQVVITNAHRDDRRAWLWNGVCFAVVDEQGLQ